MKQTYTYIGVGLILLIVLVVGAYAYTHSHHPAPAVTATASYLCRDGKTIDANFSDTTATLTLSDTRALVLTQAQSGSGIRYTNAADTIEFRSEGDNAFLEESGTQTYVDCVANGSAASGTQTPGSSSSDQQFTDSSGTFSFMYPSTVAVSGGGVGYTQDWMVNATSSGLVLAKATLDKSFQPKTNFSEATFTVGTSPDPSAVATCLTYNPSGGPSTASSKTTINGTTYMVFHSSDAGAGNLYDTVSYRTVRNNQCYAIEYTIHSTQLGNYDPSQGIKAFDADAVTKVMDGIVQSFRFTDGAK